jgi:hypothetical protein
VSLFQGVEHGSEFHPASSCETVTRDSFLGTKWPGCGAIPSRPICVRVFRLMLIYVFLPFTHIIQYPKDFHFVFMYKSKVAAMNGHERSFGFFGIEVSTFVEKSCTAILLSAVISKCPARPVISNSRSVRELLVATVARYGDFQRASFYFQIFVYPRAIPCYDMSLVHSLLSHFSHKPVYSCTVLPL